MQDIISLAMLVQWTDIAALAIGAVLYYYGRIHGRKAEKKEQDLFRRVVQRVRAAGYKVADD
jgi:hypothetical protein